jgi:hypothetical protein
MWTGSACQSGGSIVEAQIDIVGWHLHPESAECHTCDKPATVMVAYVGDYVSFNLCNDCLTNYTVRKDEISEVFRKLGL